MPALQSSAPTRLSIFVTDPDTGRPVTRLPLYVEVAVPRVRRVPPMSERFREPMRAVLFEVDPTATETAVRDRVDSAGLQALALVVDEPTRAQLTSDPAKVHAMFVHVFKDVLVAARRERMADVPPAELATLIQGALRKVSLQGRVHDRLHHEVKLALGPRALAPTWQCSRSANSANIATSKFR